MTNPITARCEALHAEGYSVSAVMISNAGSGRLRVSISRPDYVPLGEGGDCERHRITIDRKNIPQGVGVSGYDRCEDDVIELLGNEEQAEALIRSVCADGRAQDWARFDGETADYPHWLTKPNKWRKSK